MKNKPYFTLWLLCILGSWSVMPYIYSLGITQAAPFWKIFLFATIQSAILFGIVCWLSSKIIPKTDLHPLASRSFKQIVTPSLIAGVLVGFAIFFSDKYLFGSSLLSGVHPPFWAGAIASIYGAVNEEVLLRLFLFSLVYFVLRKCFKRAGNRSGFLWSTNIIVALIFGLGHMPTAFQLISPTPFEIFRILYLNGIAGILFGYLYWSRGLWVAMGAHFVTDLMIHVFLI